MKKLINALGIALIVWALCLGAMAGWSAGATLNRHRQESAELHRQKQFCILADKRIVADTEWCQK